MCLFCLKFIFKLVIFLCQQYIVLPQHRPAPPPKKAWNTWLGSISPPNPWPWPSRSSRSTPLSYRDLFFASVKTNFTYFSRIFIQYLKKYIYIFHDIFYLTRYHRLHQLLWIFFRVLSFHRLMLRHADLDDGLRLVFWKIKSIYSINF